MSSKLKLVKKVIQVPAESWAEWDTTARLCDAPLGIFIAAVMDVVCKQLREIEDEA